MRPRPRTCLILATVVLGGCGGSGQAAAPTAAPTVTVAPAAPTPSATATASATPKAEPTAKPDASRPPGTSLRVDSPVVKQDCARAIAATPRLRRAVPLAPYARSGRARVKAILRALDRTGPHPRVSGEIGLLYRLLAGYARAISFKGPPRAVKQGAGLLVGAERSISRRLEKAGLGSCAPLP